jgi:hypothetical protein
VRARGRRVSMAVAMTAPGPRPFRRAVLGLVLVLPAVLAFWWFWSRPEHVTTRFDDALDRALKPVMEQAEVQHKLGAATPTLARILARQLAERSVQYLSARDLELWQKTRVLVARSSPEACARLWKGGDSALLGPPIAALGEETLNAYTEMLARGFALRLEQKPPPEPQLGALDRGFAAIAAGLPDAARPGFEADVRRRDLSDARACELFLTLADGTARLDPLARADFLRALAKELPAAGR